MDDIEFRLTRAEVELRHATKHMGERLAILEYRMDHPNTPTAPAAPSLSPIPHLPDGVLAGMVKMAAAIALPLIILLVTGDPNKAKMAQTLLGGG